MEMSKRGLKCKSKDDISHDDVSGTPQRTAPTYVHPKKHSALHQRIKSWVKTLQARRICASGSSIRCGVLAALVTSCPKQNGLARSYAHESET